MNESKKEISPRIKQEIDPKKKGSDKELNLEGHDTPWTRKLQGGLRNRMNL